MANFTTAVEKFLCQENSYTYNLKHNKELINYGISLRFLQTVYADATKHTLANLTKNDIEQLYFDYFWLPNHYDKLVSQELAEKLFDTTVNIGSVIATRLLQRAINILILNNDKLNEDGVMSLSTIGIVNLLYTEGEGGALLEIYRLLQKEYYAQRVFNRNENLTLLESLYKRAEK